MFWYWNILILIFKLNLCIWVHVILELAAYLQRHFVTFFANMDDSSD